MKWRTLFRISNIDIYTLLVKVVNTQGLVLLRGDVNGCGAVFVLDIHISTRFLAQKT
jgi:hypothetical protein